MKKTLYIFVLLLIASLSAYAQPQYYDSSLVAGSNAFPWAVTTGKLTQFLIGPGEFDEPTPAPAGSNITTIWFQPATTTGAAAVYNTLTIKMGQTSITTLPTGVLYTGPMTTVYTAPSTTLGPTTAGVFFSVVLQTPFLYDPSQSIIVEVSNCGFTGTGIQQAQTTPVAGIFRRTNSTPSSCGVFPFTQQDALRGHLGLTLVSAGPCTDPPTAGTSTAIPSTVCNAAAATLNLTGNSVGTGQTYQWFSSTLIGGPYSTAVSGLLSSPNFVINPVATLFYRCYVTCGANTDSSTAILVTVNPAFPGGTYTINNTLATGGGNYNS
ncbi:MAG: hypothetical protein ABI723_12675, partial [Bacteroidia bacterium]